jgi:hypothetical protein
VGNIFASIGAGLALIGEIALAFTPVGQARALVEAVTGRDLLHPERELAWWERGLDLLGALPLVGPVFEGVEALVRAERVAGVLGETAGIATGVGRVAEVGQFGAAEARVAVEALEEEVVANAAAETRIASERAGGTIDNNGRAADALEGKASQELTPGSELHKETRWQEYQDNGGTWNYDRWSNVYDANGNRASLANEAVDAYQATLGWGQREVTLNATVDGVDYARRLDIADVATQRGIEYKTGYQYASQDNLWEVARDQALVQNGWDIEWVFRDAVSRPLLDALEKAGIRYRTGQ